MGSPINGLEKSTKRISALMGHCLDGLGDDICIPHIVEIIVFSQKFEDHVDHTWKVLRRLREHGVRLKPKKCRFFKREVDYLGQIEFSSRLKIRPFQYGAN